MSIHAGEQVGKSWCAWHLREEVRIMRSIEVRGKTREDTKRGANEVLKY